MSRRKTYTEPVSTFYDLDLDIESRTIVFDNAGNETTDLDSALAMRTVKALRILDRLSLDAITILINCEGGDVTAGLMVYDEIMRTSSPVHIEVVGVCYSMAAWVLQAGDHRRATRHSSIMIHDGESSASGKKNELRSVRKFQDDQDKLCEDILLARIKEKHPRFTRAKLQALLATDTYLHPHEALELGLIDAVIGDD